MGLLVLNLMLGYFTINTPELMLKRLAYLALIIINGIMLSHIIHKITHQKVVTFVDKINAKIKSKKNRKSGKPLVENLLEK